MVPGVYRGGAMGDAVYARISQDSDRDGLGVQRQIEDCLRIAPGAVIYTDNDTSAFSGRKRPAYQRLLRDIRLGRISKLVAWAPDRLHRSPLELEEFIDSVERHGVTVVTVQAGHLDLSTPAGRMIARQLGSVARYESEHKSERVKRRMTQNAERGIRHGRRQYGWDLAGAPIPHEAAVVQEIVRRVGAGEPIAAIVRDLNGRGVPAPASAAWRTGGVRSIAKRAANIGMRVHHGQVIGKGHTEPLVTEAEHHRAAATLSDPTRRTQKGTAPRYLLTGIITCGVCGAPLRAMNTRGRPVLQCRGRFCVTRSRPEVEAAVEALVLARVARDDVRRSMRPAASSRPDPSVQVSALRERQAAVVRLVALGDMPESVAADAVARLNDEIAALTAQAWGDDENVVALASASDTEAAWSEMPMFAKRNVVKALFSELQLLPTGVGKRIPVTEVLRFEWRS